jgi:hypothetical protein
VVSRHRHREAEEVRWNALGRFAFDLGDAPEGTYGVVLRVRDLGSGEERSEETSVRVHREPGVAQP